MPKIFLFSLFIAITLSSCADNIQGTEKKIDCRANLAPIAIYYVIEGEKLTLSYGLESLTLNRQSGSGSDLKGKWGPLNTRQNEIEISTHFIIEDKTITKEVKCSGNGQSRTVSVSAPSEYNEKLITIKEFQTRY